VRRGQRAPRRTAWQGKSGQFDHAPGSTLAIQLFDIGTSKFENLTLLDQQLDLFVGVNIPDVSDGFASVTFWGLYCSMPGANPPDPELALSDEDWILTGWLWNTRPKQLVGASLVAGTGGPVPTGVQNATESLRERAKAKRRLEEPCELNLAVKTQILPGSDTPDDVSLFYRWRGLFLQ